MTEEKVLQKLIDNEMEKGQSWSKLENELESVRPVFLIVHSKKLKEDKLYTIKYKAKGHGTCIFIIINEFIEGKMI